MQQSRSLLNSTLISKASLLIKEFAQVNGKFFEPEGTALILRPSYADFNVDYWQLVHSKCKPLSIDKLL